ncbi:hypothetical protein KO361_00140 [Candidatus Woesearchaeota archaeon]|nr:hypothetical protein [Candidatus Woesearchaeota archaeon]
MKIKINKTKKVLITLCLILVLAPIVNSQYTDTKDVIARVNITDAFPEMVSVVVDDPITLTGGGIKTVTCNASVRDWGGWENIEYANATLYHTFDSSHEDVDSLDYHYTNSSCENYDNDGEYIALYTCSFQVAYHATNGNWTCNVTARNNGTFIDSLSNTTTINELYALNVTSLIDYGELAVLDTSEEVNATITNFGNMAINISVEGYGETPGDGQGLICNSGSNDIDVYYQRFSTTPFEDYGLKIPLDTLPQDLGITLPKPTQSTAPVTNTTYWQLEVPMNPFGLCEGFIRFTAYAP